jgi:hypothetical protein
MPTKQFEGKIEAGDVLVAWAPRPCSPDTGETPVLQEERVGYVIGVDRYFKRDDVGIIYQMNVVPGRQRGFVGASLLKAQFERSAYGCRLYCCWCAQDIEANKFWEAMGFVPLAFRAGSEKRARVHIFWQKRIRADDQTTPYWFPSQTTGGAIGAGRIVLPIPHGTHWSDAKPLILPGESGSGSGIRDWGEDQKTLSSASPTTNHQSPTTASTRTTKHEPRTTSPARPTSISLSGGLRIGMANPLATPAMPVKPGKKSKAPRPKANKNDPRLIAAARELRDRWLERVNSGEPVDGLRPIAAKYDVRRSLPNCVIVSMPLVRPILLDAA